MVSEHRLLPGRSKFSERLMLTMALEDVASTSGMIKHDSSNFSLWKPMMEDILYCMDFYEPIVKDKIPTGVTDEDWRVLNKKAVGMNV